MGRKLSGKSRPVERIVMRHTCNTCKHWNCETGDCNCPVLFPDSTYARSPGFKRRMRENDGRDCPTYEAT